MSRTAMCRRAVLDISVSDLLKITSCVEICFVKVNGFLDHSHVPLATHTAIYGDKVKLNLIPYSILSNVGASGLKHRLDFAVCHRLFGGCHTAQEATLYLDYMEHTLFSSHDIELVSAISPIDMVNEVPSFTQPFYGEFLTLSSDLGVGHLHGVSFMK